MTDILMLLDSRELGIFRKNIGWIKERIPHRNIVVIGSKRLKKSVGEIDGNIRFIDEDKMLPGLDIASVKEMLKKICGTDRRAGWYFQQFLKMGYALRCGDAYYLIWDSDTIPVRQVALFDGNRRPYLDYRRSVGYDRQYFATISRLFPGSVYSGKEVSFVTEHMLIDVSVMKELVCEIEDNQQIEGRLFWEKIVNAVGEKDLNLSGFSEFETYAFFVRNRYPRKYMLRRWKNLRNGKFYLGETITEEQLRWLKGFDAVSLEDFDANIRIFTAITDRLRKKGVCFRDVYKVVNPFYDMAYLCMMKYRTVRRRYLTGRREGA